MCNVPDDVREAIAWLVQDNTNPSLAVEVDIVREWLDTLPNADRRKK